MDKLVLELEEILRIKKTVPFAGQKNLVARQLKIIREFENEEKVKERLVRRELEKIKRIERYKQYNISYSEYAKLLRDKDVERHFAYLFSEEFKPLVNAIMELVSNLRAQLAAHGRNDRLLEEEGELYIRLSRLLDELELSQERIKGYFRELKGLTYKKGAIRSSQVIARLIKGVMFNVDIQGIENIPKNGPCIIASRHYHAYYDNTLLFSIIPRHVFFLASVENFIGVPLADKFVSRLGAVPFKQDESMFPKRKESSIPIGKVMNYPSSNFKSFKRLIFHLSIGDAVLIYPEGEAKTFTIHEWNPALNFFPPHPGYVELAVAAERKTHKKIPIIPIGLKYSGRMNTQVKIRIGKPIYLPNEMQRLSSQKLKGAIEYYSERIFEVVKSLSE